VEKGNHVTVMDEGREFLRWFYLQRLQVGLGVDARGRRVEVTRNDLYIAALLLREFDLAALKEMVVRFFLDHPRDTTLDGFFGLRRAAALREF
jgi:hypothetical protein